MRHWRTLVAPLLVMVAVLMAVTMAPGSAYAVDDYPGKWRNVPQDSVIDDWGMYNRECTSFVAWRLHSRNGFDMPFHDNADQWGPRAQRLGFTVNKMPAVGAVAWWDWMHVAWVSSVSADGERVRIEEYNKNFDGTYSARDIAVDSVTGYIHFKDLDGAGRSPNNTLLAVKHYAEPDGTNAVYWAKEGSVFETVWKPGVSSPKHLELVRISQNDIVDIDMHVKPGNIHLLYTATKTGVWETWWTPGQGVHHALIIPDADYAGQVRKIQKTMQPDGTEQLYVMTDAGVDEYWWRPGTGIHKSRLFSLQNPVAMKKVSHPNGSQSLFVADQEYGYEVRWANGAGITVRQIVRITQRDIVDVDYSRDSDGKNRLYVAAANGGVWEASWYTGQAIGYRQIAGGTGVRAIEKWMDGSNHVVYVATAGGVFEYWWNYTTQIVPKGSTIAGSMADVHDIDRSTSAGGIPAVYIAANTRVYESWWRPGVSGPQTVPIT